LPPQCGQRKTVVVNLDSLIHFRRLSNDRTVVQPQMTSLTCSTKTLCRFGLPPGDKHGCDTLRLRVTSRRPGAWKARGPDRRRSGGFGLSAKSDTKRMVSPYRGGQRAGCLVSSRPAPLLAGELKVPGLKRVNVGELLARLSFRQEAGDCETYFVGFKAVRCCRTVRQRPCVSVVMTISPVRDHQK